MNMRRTRAIAAPIRPPRRSTWPDSKGEKNRSAGYGEIHGDLIDSSRRTPVRFRAGTCFVIGTTMRIVRSPIAVRGIWIVMGLASGLIANHPVVAVPPETLKLLKTFDS